MDTILKVFIFITIVTACVQDARCNEAFRSWRSKCGQYTCPVHTYPTDDGRNITVQSIPKLRYNGICYSTIATRNVNGRRKYRCQIPDCLPLPCQHGGKCEETLTGFKCHCPPAFTGETCETDVDECIRTGALYPCDATHGECSNNIGSYVCSCTAGYKLEGTGVMCIDDDECARSGALYPCDATNGNCINNEGSYICTCQTAGYVPDGSGGTCIVDEECFTGNGQDYRGFVSATQGGIICQKWTETSPHNSFYTPISAPNAGLGDHNYCRNPDADSRVWCYTTDPAEQWDYCNNGQAQPVCASLV